jgi:glutamyl-tRNA(Gln) amidotransferase subunit D
MTSSLLFSVPYIYIPVATIYIMYENYSKKIKDILKKNKIDIGQRILVERGKEKYEGLLMPKSSGDTNCLVIKLDNGYNIGIDFKGARINKLKQKRELRRERRKVSVKFDSSKPTIAILHAGGTIASRVDYRTGGVVPVFTADELIEMFPEIMEIANFRTRSIFQIFSEDIEPEHWIRLAKEIAKEIEKGCHGIIITHGTDTMHYTSAALAFMLQDLSIPVILVGSQRSSDRGSSDTAMNLFCAANFIANSDFSGVAICMHGSMSDEFCYILPACKTKKMHTSRRDTFRPINDFPIAKIDYRTGRIDFIKKDYMKRDFKRKLRLENKFDKNIAIIRIRPGLSAKEIEFYKTYRGIVLEGTGLGHAPVSVVGEYTKNHIQILNAIERLIKKGIIIIMTSQCPYGRINMNVYSSGRDLLKAGLIPAYMTTETTYVKLGWVLGHTRDPAEVKRLFSTNLVGELFERIDVRTFLI